MSLSITANLKHTRLEVMQFLEKKMDTIINTFLKKIDDNWQPADLLPDSSSDTFLTDIKELQLECKELPYDYLAVLVGDIITEEAVTARMNRQMEEEKKMSLCDYVITNDEQKLVIPQVLKIHELLIKGG